MDGQEVTDLCERAQRVCEKSAEIQQKLKETCAESAAIIARSRQVRSLGRSAHADFSPHIPAPARPQEPSEHDLAMEVLRMMRSLLEGFPLDWQVKIVKALTARTLLVVAAQRGSNTITLSA